MTSAVHRPVSTRPLVAAACLLLASCALSGMKVDTGGLGNTQIGQLLARTWMNSPDWISGQVAGMLMANDGAAPAVARAQAIGFECGPRLSTCRYNGSVNYRLLNLPAENAAHAKGMETISIKITSENPLVIATNKHTSE